MKKPIITLFPRIWDITAGIIALTCLPAFATTFTNNTSIGAADTTYDGTDIVVTNCTVTVDGSHAFSSLRVTAGGVLTHSLSPSGTVSNLYYVANEPQVLNGTFPVVLDSNVLTATVSVTDSGGTILYTNTQDYLLTSLNNGLTELQRTTNSAIPDGATVLASFEGYGAQPGTVPAGLNLTIAGSVEVDAGGAINVNGAGYDGGAGSGLYSGSGAGGGYGGNGAASASTALGGSPYGSFLQPTNLGSSGGGNPASSGGLGGGLVQIAAGGSVVVNGSISANGGNSTNDNDGGGSGGSIWISGLSLSGTGTITANGGGGDPRSGGGGGGGRISFQYSSTTFTGSMTAYGGIGAFGGTAGTVYTKLNTQNGLLVIDNGGRLSPTNTALALQNSTVDVLIRSNATVQPSGTWNFGNLTVAPGGLLVAFPATTIFLTTSGAITVEAGGTILATNGTGSIPGGGAGRAYNDNLYRPCGGGGYGGIGASGYNTNATGGTTYGNQSIPSGFGSVGGSLQPYSIGGSGGGGIQISTQGGIVQVDGLLSANGGNGTGSGGGGGSGGTIIVSGGTLLGSGIISANGGPGVNSIGGGGGGGRVYLSPSANLFTGTISAYGGSGANWGGAGTVFMQVSGQNTQLILDNGGHPGTNTPVTTASATDLIVRGGAVGTALPSTSFANLFLNSNGWLVPTYAEAQNPADAVNLSFSGNATIQAGGGILADFAGFPGGIGQGDGHTYTLGSTNLGGGAGHGGYGGYSYGNYASGGSAYDSATAPSSAGSGGGNVFPLSLGGTGGGIIRISVTGTFEVDGVISAKGGNGSELAGGGGSGGSIWLTAGTLSGAGSIAANGGSGAANLGGGGGGGMIYASCNNNSFTGTITAYGGGGANWGGAGTTIIQTPGKNSQLILDAGGNPGAFTPLSNSSSIDVILRNGAVGFASGSSSLGNLFISSNASLIASNLFTLNCSTLTVQAGGIITGDFLGFAAGSGPDPGHIGQGTNYPNGGGGNGGAGGNSTGNLATGGNGYSYSPEAGSGGGTSSFSPGGAGGGLIAITTTGLMQIDGIISANGGNGLGLGGGGGAGGSITLTSGSFGGGGIIRANGGSGAGSVGGGGGGGWITINVNSTANQFAGTISAYGGGGANWGGAGPIYTETSGQNVQILLDNAGNPGAGTPLPDSISSLTSLTARNGAVGLVTSSLNLNNVLIASNASLVISNYEAALTMNFTSANIEAGGSIIADFNGYLAGQGNGAGRNYPVSPDYQCSGAGHGGTGGNSYSNAVLGGLPYDTQSEPNLSGSGGGTYSPYSLGGAGGGAFSLSVSGLLQVDGIISANGGNGSGIGGGGGSGGTIKLTASTLAGGGVIRANGGSGAGSIGGGGAGGCIAIYPLLTNLFAGTISATGGGGANWAGAGTIYTQSPQSSQLVFDNGGQPGAPTPIGSALTTTALILRNGAVAYPQNSSETFASLLISSNASLSANTNSGLLSLTLTGNATIQAGGGIVTDGLGSPAGTGTGAGHSYSVFPYYAGSGGGYGGFGANTISNLTVGGFVYASVTSPTVAGSGGGNFSPYSPGGAGGGSIRLIVSGTLDDSGKISANGGNGSGSGGGGGSGGSIFLTVGTLAGNGTITANGGSGAGTIGGGGGGGRIALSYTANDFAGTMAAHGGGGSAYGGAGTIYTTTTTTKSGPQLLVDNGGAVGADTPLSTALGVASTPFNLVIQNGGIVCPQTNVNFPLLNSLTIASNGLLTGLASPSTLDVLVFNSVDIAPGGGIAVDGEGNPQATGPGAGQSIGSSGSGAGYGGMGGASATIAGGVSYGSAFQPVDFGSGGGSGSGIPAGGSAGGGVIRLNVGGFLTVDGALSAGGQPGFQDDSGGGSGGSIWVTAGVLTGGGSVVADGGDGGLYTGGGGAGGRIALYSRTNIFLGSASAPGANGEFSGANGTVVISNSISSLQVLSNSPSGIVTNAISSVVLYFNGAPNPNSVSANSVSLTTPNGLLPSSSISVSMLSSASYQVNFPQQTAVGSYTITAGQNIVDLYGRGLAQVYNGTFSVSLPVIQGTVTDTNGNPISGVTLQPTVGSPTTTDTNGNYSLGFTPGSSLTVTPSLGAFTFSPAALSYTNLSTSVTNQNYTAIYPLVAPTLTAGVTGSSFTLSWQASPGLNYQIYYSTDLTNWLPYGGPITGSNGTVQIALPLNGNPQQFYSLQAGN